MFFILKWLFKVIISTKPLNNFQSLFFLNKELKKFFVPDFPIQNFTLKLILCSNSTILGFSQIDSTVVKAFALQADGLGFNSLSGYKVGRPGHSRYVWVGQYEPSCLQFPSSVLEDKL